ncbi:hypothetical protein ACFQ1M_13790 [Sungkyunkwania multivorans]|uniref:DUF805 domain-containing protein n=1 Tax=Sungkyunkwania multivorans TaxID=1173618 RepID=A0ABW3D2K6_9FLAO
MQRWHLFVIGGISLLLSIVLGFVDEGLYSFRFLGRIADVLAVVIWAVFIAIIPVVLYVFRKQRNPNYYLLGFLPTLLMIVMIILGDFI